MISYFPHFILLKHKLIIGSWGTLIVISGLFDGNWDFQRTQRLFDLECPHAYSLPAGQIFTYEIWLLCFLKCPGIDTQQLDQQIRGIMTEVIPILKEHMDDVCSQQLLQYIKQLVLSLTKQKDDSHEFVRFFHQQLGSTVQDSFAKYEGRK